MQTVNILFPHLEKKSGRATKCMRTNGNFMVHYSALSKLRNSETYIQIMPLWSCSLTTAFPIIRLKSQYPGHFSIHRF